MFKVIDKTIGLRVSEEEELTGLDSTEHGGVAYPDFGISSHGGFESAPQSAEAAYAPGSSAVSVNRVATKSAT